MVALQNATRSHTPYLICLTSTSSRSPAPAKEKSYVANSCYVMQRCTSRHGSRRQMERKHDITQTPFEGHVVSFYHTVTVCTHQLIEGPETCRRRQARAHCQGDWQQPREPLCLSQAAASWQWQRPWLWPCHTGCICWLMHPGR